MDRRPLGAILHSSNEPGELSQWLCHDDSTINIVVLIIIIIIITDRLAGLTANGNGRQRGIGLLEGHKCLILLVLVFLRTRRLTTRVYIQRDFTS